VTHPHDTGRNRHGWLRPDRLKAGDREQISWTAAGVTTTVTLWYDQRADRYLVDTTIDAEPGARLKQHTERHASFSYLPEARRRFRQESLR
jgi:hypothetical protein